MRYIKYSDPMPQIAGLEFGWARESRYPTNNPEYFGTVPDEADIDVPGVIREFNQADYDNMRLDEMDARKVSTVTRRQGLKALFLTGITEQNITDQINAITDETERGLTMIEFKDSGNFERNSTVTAKMKSMFNLSEDDVDQLFATADKL